MTRWHVQVEARFARVCAQDIEAARRTRNRLDRTVVRPMAEVERGTAVVRKRKNPGEGTRP